VEARGQRNIFIVPLISKGKWESKTARRIFGLLEDFVVKKCMIFALGQTLSRL
jgi:hypothetical protein